MVENNQQSLSVKQMVSLRVDEVRAKNSQVRQQFSEIEALAHSIVREGQIQPIVVSPKNSEGYYVIQQGERRWRACQLAKVARIEAIINDPKSNELDEVAGELIENIQREALMPLEIAQALQRFVQQGWQQKEIAERLGKNSSFVSTHLSLLKMADCINGLYQANVTRDIETLNNLRQLYELEPDEVREICQMALEQGITRQQSREWLNAGKKRAGKVVRGAKVTHQVDAVPAIEIASTEVVALEPSVAVEPVIEPMVADDVLVDKARRLSTPESKEIQPLTSVLSSASKDIEGVTNPPQDDVRVLIDKSLSTQSDSTIEYVPEESQLSDFEEASWRRVAAEELRIVINLLSETDFQSGVLLLDRVDQQADYVWAEVYQGGQAKKVRVPVADVELVRIESETVK
ncbi:MAG: ParB/RepB/Spo0J family partition protein [Candidatus Symbiodolus clandestinus]